MNKIKVAKAKVSSWLAAVNRLMDNNQDAIEFISLHVKIDDMSHSEAVRYRELRNLFDHLAFEDKCLKFKNE